MINKKESAKKHYRCLAVFAMLIMTLALTSGLVEPAKNSTNSSPIVFHLNDDATIEVGDYKIIRYTSLNSDHEKLQFSVKDNNGYKIIKNIRLDANINNKTILLDNGVFFKIYGYEKDGLKMSSSISNLSAYYKINISTEMPDYVLLDSKEETTIPLKIKNEGALDGVFKLGVSLGGATCFSYELTNDGFMIEKINLDKNEEKKIELKIKMSDSCIIGDDKLKITASNKYYSNSLLKPITISKGSGIVENRLTAQLSKLFITGKAGEEIEVSIRLSNLGETELNDVKLELVKKNKDWKYQFSPEIIETIDSKEYSKIIFRVTLPAKADAGDYFIDLKAKSGNLESKVVKLRVNIKGDTGNSWIGIVVIFMIIGGLIFFFKKIGRR